MSDNEQQQVTKSNNEQQLATTCNMQQRAIIKGAHAAFGAKRRIHLGCVGVDERQI
jgi:hypothetical protein